MRLSKKIFIFWIVALFVFVKSDGFSYPFQITEKIKMISACRINGKWTFHLYDGVSGKKISLLQGKRHPQGYQIKSFDETTQTAVVLSPYGTFTISMNEHKPDESSTQAQVDVIESEGENTEESDSKDKKATVSRKEILEKFK